MNLETKTDNYIMKNNSAALINLMLLFITQYHINLMIAQTNVGKKYLLKRINFVTNKKCFKLHFKMCSV